MAEQNNKIPVGYKSSSLGLIPKDWDVKPLEDYGQIISGLTYSPEDVKETGVLVLRSSNVQNRQLEFKDNVFVNLAKDKYTPVAEGDILICVRNGSKSLIGKNAIITKEAEGMAFGAFMAIFRSKSNNYLYHLFETNYYQREIHINLGATINSINGSDLKKFKFPFPPSTEQSAIADLLSTWDKAIQSTTQLIAQKEQRKKWLMQQLLTGKKRLKGFEKEKWKSVKIKEVFNEIKDTNDGVHGHTIMTISSRRGLISQEDKFDRVIAGDSLKKYTQLKKNDFAYNKGNSKTYPMGCIYQLEEINSALVPFVYICFNPTQKVDPTFYKHWFFAHGLDRQLKTIISSGARGDGLLNVNTEDFFNLKISYPIITEQKAIGKIMESSNKAIQLLQNKLDKLKEQKKGLMQMLLTGKKRLNLKK